MQLFLRQHARVLHRQKNLVLEIVVGAIGEIAGVGGNRLAHGIDPGLLGLGEISQHIIMHTGFVARMADADPHAAIIVADVITDRAQAVVSGIAAADFDPKLRGLQIEFVMEDDDVGEIDLVKTRRLTDRAAGIVMKVSGFSRMIRSFPIVPSLVWP